MDSIARRAVLALPAKLFALLLFQRRLAEAAPPPIRISEFLTLSTRLTGHTKLDPKVASVYLSALLADVTKRGRLADLVRRGSSHPELEREIILAWYTGIHDSGGEKRLATHRGALLWNSLGVSAPGTCGGPTGFWARPPAEPQ